jgi:hypothetical protein
MAFSIINHVTAAATSGPLATATTGAISTVGANIIWIGISDYNPGTPSWTVSDSASNTWTRLIIIGASGGSESALYYCLNPITSAAHTFTVLGNYPSIYVLAASGAAASPLDQFNSATGGVTATTFQPGSVTPSQANEIVITTWATIITGSSSINSGFTISDQQSYSSGNHIGGAMAYLIQTTATVENPTWTDSGSTLSFAPVGVIYTFKSAAAGRACEFALLGVC